MRIDKFTIELIHRTRGVLHTCAVIDIPPEFSMRCVLPILHGSREHGRTAEAFGE
jgi:hypothetical protein